MDPTERFSNRVDDYIKWRPGYPGELMETLRAECGLTPSSIIADIGSGTGILTELFLINGNRVFAVEPNDAMRAAAERLLARYPNFVSVSGRAEATTLADRSVDLAAAGQAFHWFDPNLTRCEMLRILRRKGWVVLVWNERDALSSPFLQAYERLLETHGTDYREVDHRRVDEKALAHFYAPGSFRSRVFPHGQELDWEGLRGRLLSTSYAPAAGTSACELMLEELSRIFCAHESNGKVRLEYRTLMYWGSLE